MSSSRSLIIGSSLVAVAVLGGGCFAEGDDEPRTEAATEALITAPCPDVSGTDITRSLAVTDPTILAKFSFTRVMNQIRTTANVATTESTLGIYRRWMRTFGSTATSGNCTDANIDPNDYGLACPRPNELELAAVNPFAATSTVKLEPVALFNRFDLAPTNGASCGEYRIVYAMTSSSATLGGRAFIIFEASLPNPNPAQGIDGCFPVARFWQGLSSDTSAASRAAKLEKFYFTGTAIAGVVPVVRAANYGLSTNAAAPTTGQVRTNFFVDNVQWHLREFKLHRECTVATDPTTCALEFAHVTVKTNPAEELFAGTHARSAAFRPTFVNQVPGLASPNVNLIRMSTANQFNEFESVSQSFNVQYSSFANAAIRNDVAAKLTTMGNPSALTVNNILDRATTQTCAGCHQISNNRALGGGRVWPSSLGFAHVDEARQLSPALTTTFLPRRKAVLEKFINDRCTGVPVADGGPPNMEAGPSTDAARAPAEEGQSTSAADGDLTIGGSAAGAAN